MTDSRRIVARLRLGSGLVLFAYLLMHFANHALGLVSLDALAWGRDWFLAVWRNAVGTTALYGAFATHMGLAFWSIYRRRSLRMPASEATQLVVGVLIPPLLAIHIIGTRLAHELYGTQDSYIYELLILWVFRPWSGVQQAIVLAVAWLHGCIGLHFWLRLKPWYGRALPLAYGAALLIPLLGFLGFAVGGRDVARLAQDPAWLAQATAAIRFPDEAAVDHLYALEHWFWFGFALALAGVFAARALRRWLTRRRAVAVIYPDGRLVEIQPGTTILEASRMAGIPHASVCGGRGRCSTYRVRISEGLKRLSAASEAERRVLDRVGAPPNVRLACQTRPLAAVSVVPLLPPTATPRDAQARPGYLQGHEEEIAVLFADLRAFTELSEHKLPYDVVFLLNRYFRAMGTAVETAGGQLDKFIGDGVMALFGVGGRPADGCRQALAAARAMADNLHELNRSLTHDIEAPLRIGIGIHVGPAIVGEMGHGRATSVTAVGDTVNTASRLETLTKEYRCQLVISDAVGGYAALDVTAFARHEIAIRGRKEPLTIRVIGDARTLPETPAPPRAARGQNAAPGVENVPAA
ncbi:MAG TPA: adenylate/guanylate cyclase domain-containing protein [Methylomirabilota bacterium]|nr:adenylate/guanylate cyclase domain-containing protein [Methylomirabilota bacterium]